MLLNRNLSNLTLLLLASSFLAACAGTAPVTPAPEMVTVTPDPFATGTPTPFRPEMVTATSAPTFSPVPTGTPSPFPTATPSVPAGGRPAYTLDVLLDYAAHSLTVEETIAYPNQAGTVLDSLVLAVEPNRWSGFWLAEIKVGGTVSTAHTLSGSRLDLPLGQPLGPGETVTLGLRYSLFLPQTSADHIYGVNSYQVNLVDWFPFVVPYDPLQGWLWREPSVTGEHLVYDLSDFAVRIRPSDPTLPLTIAAPGTAMIDGGVRTFHLAGARTFAFSASAQYLVETTMVGDVLIASYYLPGNQAGGQAYLQAAARAVALYSDLFAPYPYDNLGLVEAVFPDGMESDGLVFLSKNFYDTYDGSAQNNLTAIGVHEVAHQWWFALVGNDQALEPWLDEALCTYSEWMYYKHIHPDLVWWWWNFRVKAFNPTGYVNISIYEGGSFRPYVNAVYLRGAYFLDALRLRIGDEAFYAFLKDYVSQMTGRRAAAADFFRLLGEHTDVDYSITVSNYFKNP